MYLVWPCLQESFENDFDPFNEKNQAKAAAAAARNNSLSVPQHRNSGDGNGKKEGIANPNNNNNPLQAGMAMVRPHSPAQPVGQQQIAEPKQTNGPILLLT